MDRYKKIAGVYCITNIQNSKKYVGHSTNIKKRWSQHRDVLKRNVCLNTHLQAAYNLYGLENFAFTVLEVLPFGLTKQEYEKVETDWILKFNSHQADFGYNAIMPGSYPLRNEGENITNVNGRGLVKFKCINTITEEIIDVLGTKEASELTTIAQGKITDLADYWKNIGKRKSLKGWMIVREEDYSPKYDYINSKKTRKDHLEVKKTWRDYEATRTSRKKDPKDIIPRKDRNLKRRGIIAVNILTGEEREYRMVKDSYKDFCKGKVSMCLRFPFGKHQHRGHHFRYNDI